MKKPILCLDFDGVIHSYSSGWRGAANIPDAPVPGALEFIVGSLQHFTVAIFSSRSHQWGGRRAMKRWLKQYLVDLGTQPEETPKWWMNEISKTAFADPWPDEVEWAARQIINAVQWPLFKPSAMISIDDRALTFNGNWPAIADLKRFKPWNKP